MYFRGDLVVHHKKGTIKYYDLAENCLPNDILAEPDPNLSNYDYHKWQVLRRIGAVGMLWNKASDAWLNINSLKSPERTKIFDELYKDNKIVAISVEGINNILFCKSEDTKTVEYIKTNPILKTRCEFLAPLDNMLWDRKLIKALFDFDYKWEIYTPEVQRKYGYYVLPILYGDSIVGRIEAVNNRKEKQLIVKNIWFEEGIKETAKLRKAIDSCIKKFAKFNDCESTLNFYNQ